MVARGAGLDPPRSGEVAGDDAAQRAARRRLRRQAIERAPIRRLEGQHLAGGGEGRVDLGEPGRSARGQDQLARLVIADPGEPRQVEGARQLQRPAEPALRPAGDDFERLLGGERIADHVAQFGERIWRIQSHPADTLSLRAQRSNLVAAGVLRTPA